ncbi:MAG: L-seryl-tRNA(Sec) selenium transferase [Bryobacter sp.]|nr:L-seryl-tRNA(Sec) selenium transferase [Bryobacter sp.]
MSANRDLRALPSVDALAKQLAPLESRFPRALDHARSLLRRGQALRDLQAEVAAGLESLASPSLIEVINATGVVLHTNLGRAPLPETPPQPWYTNLEYDLASGRRGKRDRHTARLLERLLDRPAILVNNGAAAVYLALHELAGDGGEVVVSRGELIEIGDGFRIPDIMQRSGARLVEAGTTNRTRLDDYRRAINSNTRLLMRVHPSNFRIQGFTARPAIEELATLARETGIPLYEDLGSGCLGSLAKYGIDEPPVRASLDAGVHLVSFSGDKLLGGPQAGVLAGDALLIERLRANPMFRALRVDKLIVAAMETCLRAHLLERMEALPVQRMLSLSVDHLRDRAARILAGLGGASAEVREGESLIGGGSTPAQSLPSVLIALHGDATALERALRTSTPPVIARIVNHTLLLDLRTVPPEKDALLVNLVRAALL